MTACSASPCPNGAGPHERHPGRSAEHRDLIGQIHAAYLDALRHRDRAATDPTETGRVRAVAHQTHASRLLRILDTQETP